MKQIYLLTLCLVIFSFNANAQTWEWTKPEPISNGDSTGNDDPHDIARDANGNVYVLGNYMDRLYLDNVLREQGSWGSFLAKYDSTGILLWYNIIKPVQFGTPYPHYIEATDIVVNATGIFLTGTFTGSGGNVSACPNAEFEGVNYEYKIGSFSFTSSPEDIGLFIAKLNFNGEVVWNETATIPLCEGNMNTGGGTVIYHPLIATDNNNNIISSFECSSFIGHVYLNGSLIPTNNSQGAQGDSRSVVKLNSNGIVRWSNYASGNVYDFNSLICDNKGNTFLYGTAGDQAQFGSIQFHTSFASPTILAKIDSSGTWQFVKELTNSSFNVLEAGVANPDFLACDNQNNIYAIVNLSESSTEQLYLLGNLIPENPIKGNVYILKLNNQGNARWYKNFAKNNTGFNHINSIFYSNNSLYVAGSLQVNPDYYFQFSDLTFRPACSSNVYQYFVAKSDTSGAFKWATSFCANSNTEGFSICTSGNSVYTCGYFRGSINTLGNLNGTEHDPDFAHRIFIGRLRDQYIHIGALNPVSICPGSNISIPFTSVGLAFLPTNIFTAELSDKNGIFNNPKTLGTINSTGSGTITGTIPANMALGNQYRVRIKSSDTLKTGYPYYTYADTPYIISVVCPAPSSGFSATNISSASAKLNWNTTGCAIGYKVQYRITGAWSTVNVSGNTGTINISGLTSNKTYQWKVATKCQNNKYSPYSAIQQFTTLPSFAADESINNAETASSTGISISPNPAKNQLRISVSSLKTIVQSLQVLDAGGNKVAEKTFSTNNHGNIKIDVTNYAPGLYMLLLKTNEGVIIKKFIKE